MKKERIEDIRKGFHDEWLLIAVDEVDPKTHAPLLGHLLAHGPSRKDIHEQSKQYEGLAYVVSSEEWPDDLAACFVSMI